MVDAPWIFLNSPIYMACIRGKSLMIIPEEPEYILLWLSNCEWNQLDGREAGLDLIIGDFGEM